MCVMYVSVVVCVCVCVNTVKYVQGHHIKRKLELNRSYD